MTDSITITVPLADLLKLTVEPDDWPDGHGLTMAELVAREIVQQAQPVPHSVIADEVRKAVAVKIREAMSLQPDAGGSLSSLIIAEARAQLGPESQYHGSATPMQQWLAAEVYRAIREPAVELLATLRRTANQTVAEAIREEVKARFPE